MDGLIGISKIFWYGTFESVMNNKFIGGFYGVIGAWIIGAAIFDHPSMYAGLIVAFITALVLGIKYYITEILPGIQNQAFFDRVFKDIKLKTENNVPRFLHRDDRHQFVTTYAFKCYCPLKMWQAKKDYLEMHMNAKIVDIIQNETERDVIYLFTEKQSLSNSIPWSNKYISQKNKFNIGASHFGFVGMDLDKHPHAFIAGETGSGKSNILKCLIHQAIEKDFEVVLIDFKRGVSFSEFSNKVTVYHEYNTVKEVLNDMVEETTNRLDKFRDVKVDNFHAYNSLVKNGELLNKKIIFIDELAELLKAKNKDTANALHESIETLTRLSRAVGIHLIMAIQRPDSTVVGGQIKNNVPYRVCGRFVDKEPSRIMLGNDTATSLPNIKGRFIIKDDDVREVQAFYLDSAQFVEQDNANTPRKRRESSTDRSMRKIPSIRPASRLAVTSTVSAVDLSKEQDIAIEPSSEYNFEFDSSLFKK